MGMNLERFNKKVEDVNSNSGIDFDFPKLVVPGVVRIFGDFASAYEHFAQNSPTAKQRPFYCDGPDSDCPLCQLAARFATSDDPEKQKLAGEIKAKEKFYFNVLDRSPAGKVWHAQNKKTYLLAQTPKANNVGSMVFKNIGAVAAMRKQIGRNEDPTTYDIVISKSGSGMNTTYSVQFTGDETPLTEEELAYATIPLEVVSKRSTIAELETAVAFYTGASKVATPGQYTATSPVQNQKSTISNQQKAVTTQPQSQKLVVKKQSQYQNTNPVGRSGDNLVIALCPACNADMMIDMNDPRNLECHKCGAVYDNPNPS